MLTYITTYCDNPEYLEQVLDNLQACPDERLKLIVVDDCSDVSPVEIIRARSDSRVSLYRITEDLGFNSHGARNLAMKETTTEWNLLVDIDFEVENIANIIKLIEDNELEPTIPHFFSVNLAYKTIPNEAPRVSVNDFLITKTAYWKQGGYDPEFFGWHHGDRAFLHRLVGDNRLASVVFGSRLHALRSPFARTVLNPELSDNQEKYNEDRTEIHISVESQVLLRKQEALAIERHKNNTQIDLTPFAWEQVI